MRVLFLDRGDRVATERQADRRIGGISKGDQRLCQL